METNDQVIAKAGDKAVTVRFPHGLVERLTAAGKRAGRSRNSEIVMRLIRSLDMEEDGLAIRSLDT